MNEYKTCCVIDKDGFYISIVAVHMERDPQTGNMIERIERHKMLDGESLLPCTEEIRFPTRIEHAGQTGFIRPRWDGGKWVEDCTEAEISEWEAEHPAPEQPAPTPSALDVLGGQVAQLALDGMQKNQIVSTLGAELAQTKLDVMVMKQEGGV